MSALKCAFFAVVSFSRLFCYSWRFEVEGGGPPFLSIILPLFFLLKIPLFVSSLQWFLLTLPPLSPLFWKFLLFFFSSLWACPFFQVEPPFSDYSITPFFSLKYPFLYLLYSDSCSPFLLYFSSFEYFSLSSSRWLAPSINFPSFLSLPSGSTVFFFHSFLP